MVGVNPDYVFSQIVTIAKSNAAAHDLRRRAAQRIEQFTADAARSGCRPEAIDKKKNRLKEMLRVASTGGTLAADEKAVFIEAFERLCLEKFGRLTE